MRATIQTKYLTAFISKIKFKTSCLFATLFCMIGSLLSTSGFAQITNPPTQCTSGCTSNDVQIKNAYLSDASGNKLLSSFICPPSGTATVYLTLELTTNTPRVGVSIFTKIKTYINNTVGNEVPGSPISECFGTTLNQPTNKVTFKNTFNWTCGTPIVMTDVYLAWGTGNTNFCGAPDAPFKCPATPSKCFQLPPNSFIAIQTPTPQIAAQTKCEETAGGGTAHFNLTQSDATITNGQNVIISGWYTDYNSSTGFSGLINDSTNYSSGNASIYAQVCDATHTSVCSPGTLTLSVNSRPAASASGDVITCSHTSATLSGSGSATTGVSYLWSGSGSITNSTLINATTATGGTYSLLVTNTTTGCSASATAAVSVNQTAPTAVAIGGTITCSHPSVTLSPSNSSAGTGFSQVWTGPSPSTSTVSNLTVTTGGLYTLTVTNTGNGCSASASASVSVNNTLPTAAATGGTITCANTSISISGSGSTPSGVGYSWSGPGVVSGGSTLSPTVNAGGTYTLLVSNSDNGCSATASASVSVNQTAPTFTVCLVQPTLCDNTAGSVTVHASGGNTFSYKLNNGTPQGTNTFSGLGGGSVSSITVTNENGCLTKVNCADLQLDPSCGGTPLTTNKQITQSATISSFDEPTVKAYPNPFSDEVKFVISAPISGNGSLEVYNIMGQKVKTIYQGHINAGNQTFKFTAPKKQQATLIYVFKVGDQKITGKLLQMSN